MSLASPDRGSAALTSTMTYAATTLTADVEDATTTTTAAASPAPSDYTTMMTAPPPGSRPGLRHNHDPPGKPDDAHNNNMHAAGPAKSGDWQDAVVDSGIEELDSHSSDHHLEMLGMKPERGGGGGGGGGGGDGAKAGEHQDPCMSYAGSESVQVQNMKTAIPVFPKITHYKEAGGRAPPVALRRQSSTHPAAGVAPPSHADEDFRREGTVAEERKRRQNRSKLEDGFGSTLAACLDRPVDPRTVGWGDVPEPDRPGGGLHRGGISHEGRRLHSPLSGVKASIINELSSKLQQMGSVKSMDDWSHAPKSPTMHR